MTITALLLMFSTATNQYQLPSGLLASLCYVESRHNPKAINPDDGKSSSLGVCQIKLETAKLMGFKGSVKELMDPKVNIKYAAKYLKKQIDRYDGDIPKAVAAYNAGSYRENKKKVAINSAYVKKVFAQWALN